MSKKIFYFAFYLIVAAASNSFGGWQAQLDSLLKTDNKATQDSLIAAIVKANPGWGDISTYIRHLSFPPMEKGKIIMRQTRCIDNVLRPWALYVPSSYNPSVSTPLLVILHGAVMRRTIRDDAKKWAEDYPFTALGEKRGWLVLYPFGQAGATWWDEVGIKNVLNLVRSTKRLYNVDDNKVWLGGFSDGGSASYLMAMIKPNDFSVFLPLNGDLGIAGRAGNIQTYAPNLSNSFIYAVNTTGDDYYPISQVRKEIALARDAGGVIVSKEYPGPHDFVYKDQEMPLISDFLEHHARNPLPSRVVWETADTRFGNCRWIAIDSLAEIRPAAWYKDINLTLIDSGITMGFAPDTSYKGNGVMVGRMAMGGNLATLIGLQPGDIITKINGQRISNPASFDKLKTNLKRGQTAEMLITRNGNELPLSSRLPEPSAYQLFDHSRPSGRINASYAANSIEIESSRVGKFHILVHPDLIHPDQNLTIRWNGKITYNKIVKPDLRFMLRNFLANRDRRLLYIAEIEF